MTKEQMLDLLRLLAALESWTFATGSRLPDYLHDSLSDTIDNLRREILK